MGGDTTTINPPTTLSVLSVYAFISRRSLPNSESLALQGTKFIELLNHTARLTAEGLAAEYCKVLEYIPAEN